MHQGRLCIWVWVVHGTQRYVIPDIQGYNNKIILPTHDQKLWWNATVNLSADAASYSGDWSGTTTQKSTPEADTSPTALSKRQKHDISPAAQGKTEIGVFGMPITIPTQKQADYIEKNSTISQNQRHLWSNNHTWSASDVVDTQDRIWPAIVNKTYKIWHTHKKIKHDPATTEASTSVADPPDQPNTTLWIHKSAAETHENNKTALILGSIIFGSVALLIYEFY